MKWKPFVHKGENYSLAHVHPFNWEFVSPATKKRPERKYLIRVTFSMHTFTCGIPKGKAIEPTLCYRDSREVRQFSFRRYQLSMRLPEIIQQLGERNCYHTHHGNFFTIDLINDAGEREEYEIYFKFSRSKQNGQLNLYVQSAYLRDPRYQTAQPKKRKIGFQVIAYNTTVGKRIKLGR